MIQKIILLLLVLLISASLSIAGNRKTVTGNTLLDVGECNKNMCVLAEEEIEVMLFQEIDFIPYDGKCDFVILFKRLTDPTHGDFYRYYSTQDCRPEKGKPL